LLTPIPSGKAKKPRSIQNSKYEAALLAGLALWLARPSSAGFTLVFHAISWATDDVEMPPYIQGIESHNKVEGFGDADGTLTSLTDVMRAGRLHGDLLKIPRKNAAWSAMRAIWSAITTSAVDLRYLPFWIALEALFGPNDGIEVSYKIAQRISFFTADASKSARENFRLIKACYAMRSKIAHGRWEGDPKMAEIMRATENIARTVFLYLLCHPNLMAVFQAKKRDEFLEDWVFSRQIEPPPLEKYVDK